MDWLLIFSALIILSGDPAPRTAEMRVLGLFPSQTACRREAAAIWRDVQARPEHYSAKARRLLGNRTGGIDFEMSCRNVAIGEPL